MIEVELPDGSVAEFPDGTSNDVIQGAMRKRFATTLRPAVDQGMLDANDARARNIPQPTGTQRAWASMPGRLFQGGLDTVDAGAQLLANTFGSKSEADRVNQIVRDRGLAYEQAKTTTGFDGADIARPVGSAITQILATRGLGVPAKGASLLNRAALGAGTGAAFGALQPVSDGEFWQEKAEQTGTGAAFGALAAPATEAIARAIRPSTSDAVKTLRQAGVAPTIGQILGGPFKSAEEKLSSLPLLGGVIRSGQDRATIDLNSAVWDRVLAPIGKKMPAGTTGFEAVAHADDAISAAYTNVINKIGAVPVTPKLGQDMAELSKMVAHLPKERVQQFKNVLQQEIVDRADNNRLTGEAIKQADSNLRQIGESYLRTGDADQRTLGAAFLQARKNLMSWLEDVAPTQHKELRAVNESYANFIRGLKATNSAGAKDGVFSAAQLNAAVKSSDPAKHHKQFGRSEALLQDLSRAGANVLQNRVPNSGTADRALASTLALAPGTAAAYFASPGFAALAAPAALYAPGVQRGVAAALTSRPQFADPLAELMRQSSPIAGAGLYGLLGQE